MVLACRTSGLYKYFASLQCRKHHGKTTHHKLDANDSTIKLNLTREPSVEELELAATNGSNKQDTPDGKEDMTTAIESWVACSRDGNSVIIYKIHIIINATVAMCTISKKKCRDGWMEALANKVYKQEEHIP